jgi:hypothetical protein
MKYLHLATTLLVLVLLLTGGGLSAQTSAPIAAKDTVVSDAYKPNLGFKIASSKYGDVNFKIYTYLRYLNQTDIDTTYVNAFGKETRIDPRQDIILNKVNLQFLGWFMDPKLRYIFYAWTNNTAQGQGAQVVLGGSLTYNFKKYFKLGGGIGALPGVRCTEGNFPNWLTVDNRLMADEFFRPSYTMGVWAQGDITPKLTYHVMLGNNLSQLGIDAGQLDDKMNTVAASINYFPTTGEFGLNSAMGDFEQHQKVATRLGLRYSSSTETRQGQPDTEGIDNVQLRTSDGSIIFSPGLFAQGVQIDQANYHMTSFDAGVKYKGFALEGEYYWRLINSFKTIGSGVLPISELQDNGFQLQASAMLIPQLLQVYVVGSTIFGQYGDPEEYRAGVNFFPYKSRSIRLNAEVINCNNSPVGALSLPYTVGANGNIIHANLEINF